MRQRTVYADLLDESTRQLDLCAGDGRVHADADTPVQVTVADRARASGLALNVCGVGQAA